MIVIGTDAHKRSHTCSAVREDNCRELGWRTASARDAGHGELLAWARGLDDAERVWAIEDCRHVSGGFERFLLARGERVVRVPPKLMAGARRTGRQRGKSDQIDAQAIARAAIAEGLEQLPVAQLDERTLEIRQLADHRERLVRQRVALICDLRWHLHDLDPSHVVRARGYVNPVWQQKTARWLARRPQCAQVRIARDEIARIRELTKAINKIRTRGSLRSSRPTAHNCSSSPAAKPSPPPN